MEELHGWGHQPSQHDEQMSALEEMARALTQRHPGLESFKRDARGASRPLREQDNDIKAFVVNRTSIEKNASTSQPLVK